MNNRRDLSHTQQHGPITPTPPPYTLHIPCVYIISKATTWTTYEYDTPFSSPFKFNLIHSLTLLFRFFLSDFTNNKLRLGTSTVTTQTCGSHSNTPRLFLLYLKFLKIIAFIQSFNFGSHISDLPFYPFKGLSKS